MRLPKTSRPPCEDLPEVYIGRGDYAAGGARSLPFLDLDCARRRRPLVLGEITDDLSGYPELASGMFSGRQEDPAEWAVMWKELGADGVCIRITKEDKEEALDLVRSVSDRTRLPVAVDACEETAEYVASKIDDTRLLVFTDGTAVGEHVPIVRCTDADDAAAKAGDMDNTLVSFYSKPLGGGSEDYCKIMEGYRGRGLSGEKACRHAMLADVTCAWEHPDALQGGDVRRISLWEATGALTAMLAGADILIVRGPGAADMARVYGEELADL